jgi:hypothetical protein
MWILLVTKIPRCFHLYRTRIWYLITIEYPKPIDIFLYFRCQIFLMSQTAYFVDIARFLAPKQQRKPLLNVWESVLYRYIYTRILKCPRCIWHSVDRASWYILIMKADKMHYFSYLFDKVLYMFRTGPLSIIGSISTLCTCNRYLPFLVLLPSASVVRMEQQTQTELAWQIPIASIQCWDTPDDGQWTCLKRVEFFIKWIWEIVHLVCLHYKNRS